MTQDPTKMPHVDHKTTPISADRRRLLKAAAISTPIIATLPSGAVFANASSIQCLIDAEANRGVANVLDPPSDHYIRFAGVYGQWYGRDAEGNLLCMKDGEVVDCSVEGAAPSTAVIFMAYGKPRPTPNEWVLVDAQGNPIQSSWNPPSPYPATPDISTPKDLLVIFIMDGEGTGATEVGWAPLTSQETGFGMVPSCLCSVDPQLRGNSPFC